MDFDSHDIAAAAATTLRKDAAMTTPSPLTRTLRLDLDATATGADSKQEIGTVPGAAGGTSTVTSIAYEPSATVTGANTNSRTITVTNRKADGTGIVVLGTLALTSGVNATADVPKALTLNSTAANLVVNAGDVLTCESTHVGTGLADPGGVIEVNLSRTTA